MPFEDELANEFGIVLKGDKKAHPPVEKWWQVFGTIFKYDPNALVHGVLFPKWQIKIPRVLTAHMEAVGAARVDRAGVKFDRLGRTTSGQPIFAVDDSTAREIRATFIVDVALVRSFGRANGERNLGLTREQREFLIALALWKIRALLSGPFRFRSGCLLQCMSLKQGGSDVQIDVDMQAATGNAMFRSGESTEPVESNIFWPREELYQPEREGARNESPEGDGEADENEGE
jgi:CRISPR-associated protein Csb1